MLFIFTILNFITISYHVALKVVAFFVISSDQIEAWESPFDKFKKSTSYFKKALLKRKGFTVLPCVWRQFSAQNLVIVKKTFYFQSVCKIFIFVPNFR